ncbi:amidohydrolase family protein [Pseudonocardiaceae bacterium YIM PH 21723]|nr:amidohydrolase family protein [Pseudonocardiaceae bacterium YIM PH 21723]
MSSTAIFADRAVLSDGATILAVGSAAEIEALCTPDTRRLSFPDSTVLPGLIDAHVHLAFDASPDPVSALIDIDDTALLLGMTGRAQQLLAAGVTTARDLGDRGGLTVALRDAIAAGIFAGPRILAATAPLTSVKGHCWFMGGEVGSDGDIRDRIAANRRAGADLIKVMASGGAMTPGGPKMWEAQFDAEQLRLIVAEAGRYDLPVAAHAHGTDTIGHCVDAGVRTIEHCSWRNPTGLEFDPEIARRIAEREIAVCRCISGDWRVFLDRMGPHADALLDSIRAMRDAGVRFIAGTDAGVPGAWFGDYVGMLEFFAEVGFSNAEIIDMATVNAADALGLPDTGRLAPGMRADLIVVNGDPLQDLGALRNLDLVLAAGSLRS